MIFINMQWEKHTFSDTKGFLQVPRWYHLILFVDVKRAQMFACVALFCNSITNDQTFTMPRVWPVLFVNLLMLFMSSGVHYL